MNHSRPISEEIHESLVKVKQNQTSKSKELKKIDKTNQKRKQWLIV